MPDVVITNAGLMGVIGIPSSAELQEFDIDPEVVADAVKMCSNNVRVMLSSLNIFLAPTLANIEALLFGVSIFHNPGIVMQANLNRHK